MRALRIVYHLARADFLERVRRYSFLIMLGLGAILGYQVAVGNIAVRLDIYRGEFNSAWVGSMMALIGSFFLGWFGFYLVKGSIARDRETGVGQIMAATPLTRPLYTLGKWASNFSVLMAMIIVLAIASIGIQFLAGENTHLDLLASAGALPVRHPARHGARCGDCGPVRKHRLSERRLRQCGLFLSVLHALSAHRQIKCHKPRAGAFGIGAVPAKHGSRRQGRLP